MRSSFMKLALDNSEDPLSSVAYKPLQNECDEGVESAEMLFQPHPGQTLLSVSQVRRTTLSSVRIGT